MSNKFNVDFSEGEHVETDTEYDFKYPSYEDAGADKKWDEMSELEKANYNHCKTLNALVVCMTTAKRRREAIERLTLSLNLAEGRNRELREWKSVGDKRYLMIKGIVFETLLFDQWDDGDFEADSAIDSIRVLVSKNDKGYFVANAMDGYGNNIRRKFENEKVILLTPIATEALNNQPFNPSPTKKD